MTVHPAVPLSSTAYGGRSVKVDCLRGIFAIFVALGHLYDMARLNSDATGWLDVPRSLFGTNWVIGFVVISGFLIESSVESMIKRGGGGCSLCQSPSDTHCASVLRRLGVGTGS